MQSVWIWNSGVTSSSDWSMQQSCDIKESENLDDLDSYFEDIKDRLTISRMVSDSVIKGMIKAVVEEASEKIALKELEVESLNKKLHFYKLDGDKLKEFSTSGIGPNRENFRLHSSFPETGVDQDGMEDYLGNLRLVTEGEFQRLRKEIEDVKECSTSGRMHSGSAIPGLGDIQQGEVYEKWVKVDKTLDMMNNTLKTFFKQVDDVVYSSKASLCEWQEEQVFQEELEAMVIQNSIRSLQEEFKAKLWLQSGQSFGSQNLDQVAKINEISGLRKELEAISRSFSSPEIGHLPSHGSQEGGEEWSNAKRKDHFHRNGKHEESRNTSPETMDSTQLKHMSKDELINYFKTEMTKMKRNYELEVREKTEQLFSYKRELLKERGPSSSLRKDKEFDALKKKIPEVILKLDDILMENGELPVTRDDSKNLCILKDRLDALQSENCQLKDLLTDERKKVKCLSSQVSDTADKMSHHSLSELNLLKQIMNLKCDIEDAKIEVSVREERFKCVLMEVFRKIKWDIEDSNIVSIVLEEICGLIFTEVVKDAEATIECGIEDADMEYIIMQEMYGIIFREALNDAKATINIMKMDYKKEDEKLKLEIHSLSFSMVEKEKLAIEARSELMKERENFQLVCQELSSLKDDASKQLGLYGIRISELNQELNLAMKELSMAVEERNTLRAIVQEKQNTISLFNEYGMRISELNQELNLAIKELSMAVEEINTLHAIVQEKQNTISLFNENERDHRKQVESIVISVIGLSKAAADFEHRVMENVKRNNSRLEKLNLQCTPLVQKADSLRRMGLVYKQRLERRYSDLQKAEAEVGAWSSSSGAPKRSRTTKEVGPSRVVEVAPVHEGVGVSAPPPVMTQDKGKGVPQPVQRRGRGGAVGMSPSIQDSEAGPGTAPEMRIPAIPMTVALAGIDGEVSMFGIPQGAVSHELVPPPEVT